jgi:hypothetical protein
MDGLIHYVCIAQGHQQLGLFDSTSTWAPNVLTFYEGRWSYCPAGERSGHRWNEVSPRPYEELRDEIQKRIESTA